MDQAGSMVPGELEASNLEDLERKLAGMELDLVSQKQVRKHRRGKVSRKDLIAFCVHMEQLTRAGVPIMEGLDDLRTGAVNPVFQGIVAAIISEIEGGRTLSQALEMHPTVFDEVFTALVAAGEATGQLSEVFKNLSESIKWQDEIIAQTKKAVLYPAFVLLVVGAAIAFLMIYLVPQLVEFIRNVGEDIPMHTRALIATSNAFVNYWYLIFGLPILLAYGYRQYRKINPIFVVETDRIKLKLWVIGPILEKIALARFANYFALTYRAGLGVMDCIRICEGVVHNAWLRQGLQNANQMLSEGESISKSFERTKLFPLLILRMLKVGESTGGLDEALLNVSYFYDRDVRESISRMQTMIEPALTVVLGLILGWVMLSVLGPIYDSLGKMGV
ncbi:MAG: type II secretion system F family protein [Gammaproteobacteria bacterium]|nr:type II secretion system F family protein [Gammaproteobacteria bacterium]